MSLELFLWDAKTKQPVGKAGTIDFTIGDPESGEIFIDPDKYTLAVKLNHLLVINPQINPKQSAESAKETV